MLQLKRMAPDNGVHDGDVAYDDGGDDQNDGDEDGRHYDDGNDDGAC